MKRELTIVDDSFKSVRLTLWDVQAEKFDSTGNPIIACKGCRVNDFGGRSLSMSSGGTLKINMEIPETQKLRKWYNEKGQSSQFGSFNAGMVGMSEGGSSNRKITLAQVKTENLGMGDRPDYFSFRGTVMFIKSETFSYPACPECKKKVLMESNGWRCEKCQKTYPEPDHRYILSLSVEDATSQIYVSGFDDMGLSLLKMSANELNKLKDEDSTAAQLVINKALFSTYNFKIRAKQETFNVSILIYFNQNDFLIFDDTRISPVPSIAVWILLQLIMLKNHKKWPQLSRNFSSKVNIIKNIQLVNNCCKK
jgi:replication factor A1